MIPCQRRVHYYSERGDLVEQRFGLMMKNMNFHGSGTFDKAFWMFHKQMWCADACGAPAGSFQHSASAVLRRRHGISGWICLCWLLLIGGCLLEFVILQLEVQDAMMKWLPIMFFFVAR